MAERLRITKTKSEQLDVIASESVEFYQNLARELNQHEEAILYHSQLNELIKSKISNDNLAEILTDNLVGLATASRDKGYLADEMVDILIRSIKDSDYSDEEKIAKWNELRGSLVGLLSSRPVCNVTKVLDLIYDHEKILEQSRIITDVRPVFDEAREEIVSSIVGFTLRIDYFDNNGEQFSQSLALDENDIRNLRDICEIAIKKANKIKNHMMSGGVNTLIAGEEKNDAT